MRKSTKRPPAAQVERARRLQKLIDRGPAAPRTPHEFVEGKAREARRARKGTPGGAKKR
jgi:hypothetical protein